MSSPVCSEDQASFPLEIVLPEGQGGESQQASEAIREEYRASVRWKRLRCRRVVSISDDGEDSIFALEVGHSVEFDWTWEGAVAFRPRNIEAFDGRAPQAILVDEDETADARWSGEIVEVDQDTGRIYVWLTDPERRPTTGSFFVRPFEFLACLHSIYADHADHALRHHLSLRLHASRGTIHPALARSTNHSIPELHRMWSHSWGVLWGPPGTGKTHTIGRQVARCLDDPDERLLVVSTTNRATDEAAISAGVAVRDVAAELLGQGHILRIGKGAQYRDYEERGLLALLEGTESDLLRRIAPLLKAVDQAKSPEEKALLRKEIQSLRKQMKDAAQRIFLSTETKAVVATAFKALTLLAGPEVRRQLATGRAPITTIVIDEAGLISRAAVAALTLLASRRVVLVGDPRQLAPISRISRILPTKQATWLERSGLSHLRSLKQDAPGVHILLEQHRMHQHICSLISGYQYEDRLTCADSVSTRAYDPPKNLAGQPRTIWYVLDEETNDTWAIRAERGPGNRSWARPITQDVLKKFLFDEGFRNAQVLFVTPFAAQARFFRQLFATMGLDTWSSTTVHSQQGSQADIVVFDTVNGGSTGWPPDEWKRLVNVGLSRAKHHVILIASRAEMRQPYLRELILGLTPAVLKWSGNTYRWEKVPAEDVSPETDLLDDPELMGNQIRLRKTLRPVLSSEQERLCGLSLDGKPRLVRGVAGSGKTVVLAHWVAKTIERFEDAPDKKIWVVYANAALSRMIQDTIQEVLGTKPGLTPTPTEQVSLCHVKDILGLMMRQAGVRMEGYDYDRMAAEVLARLPIERIPTFCQAMFIDEAQDMGPNTLQLLSAMIERADPADPKSRSINIFYDNAQNIYGRSTPKWIDLGIDLRGRSTVMKESFRSTKPITEFALNVLYRLKPPESDPDHKELIDRGLIERTERNGKDWWLVRFNQVNGPTPIVKFGFPDTDKEFVAIANQIISWVRGEGVRPGDIRILYNGKPMLSALQRIVEPVLRRAGVRLLVQVGSNLDNDPQAVVATTAQSFKGYDAEIIMIAGTEQFTAKSVGVLAHSLYVAMTRARSILAVYGRRLEDEHHKQIATVCHECVNSLIDQGEVDGHISGSDEFEDVLQRLGGDHRKWLEEVWRKHQIVQEPIVAEDGEVLAEPLFWYRDGETSFACFDGEPPDRYTLNKLEDVGVKVLKP
jgi:superfamily I DNA/RNA helicase